MRVGGYMIEVDWLDIGLPEKIGPFSTRADAEEWARLKTPNGIPQVHELAAPYAAANGAAGEDDGLDTIREAFEADYGCSAEDPTRWQLYMAYRWAWHRANAQRSGTR